MCSKQAKRKDIRIQKQSTKKHEGYKIHCLQLNATSILPNLNEFRSLLAEIHPDLVCIQEDGITADHVPYKVDGFIWLHHARSQPRSPTGHIRGGGVSILVRSDLSRLRWKMLPPISLDDDVTTEMIRVRLYWTHPGGNLILDVINIYRPPISSSPHDIRQDLFDVDRITPLHQDNQHLSSNPAAEFMEDTPSLSHLPTTVGVLLCGDFNAHHSTWDRYSKVDHKGKQMFQFAIKHNLKLANDGEPTCFLPAKHPTAVDLTFSNGDYAITD